jgi:hypothetical protein
MWPLYLAPRVAALHVARNRVSLPSAVPFSLQSNIEVEIIT